MLLDLGKAFSFLACIVVLYRAAIDAFFVPGTQWEDRLLLALMKISLAACVCLLSGLIFTWPVATNPGRTEAFAATLPVRLFFWALLGITLLFLCSWYLGDLAREAAPFISSRSHEGL